MKLPAFPSFASGLRARLMILLVATLCVAQLLNAVALSTKRRLDFDEQMSRLAVRQFAAQLEGLATSPKTPLPIETGVPISVRDDVWRAPQSVVALHGLESEPGLVRDLVAELTRRKVPVPDVIQAKYETYSKRRPPPKRDDRPTSSAPERSKGAPPPPSETFFAVRGLGEAEWINARLRSSPPPPPMKIDDILINVMVLGVVVCGGVIAINLQLSGALSALTDATQRVGTNAQLPQASKGFPTEVQLVFGALDQMNNRINELLIEKDVMLGAIGHDLRTPLTSLRLRVEQMGPADARERAIQALDQTADLLADILDLARAGRSNELAARYNVTSIVDDVVADYEDQGLPVTFSGEPRISASCQPNSIKRMLQNIINNALAYGGNADVSLFRKDNNVCLVVEDNGPGMPAAALTSLKQPFKRGEESRSSATGGSGLGLTIAQMIARAHGGKLEVSNRTPHGLRVEIALPAQS